MSLELVLLSHSSLGGWSADGITLPGAVDLECQWVLIILGDECLFANR